MKFTPVNNFVKLFFSIIYIAMSLLPTDVCALGAHSVYNTKGINCQKRFMKLTPVTNFIKLFWHNLGCYWCAATSFDYINRGANYTKKVLWNWHLHFLSCGEALSRFEKFSPLDWNRCRGYETFFVRNLRMLVIRWFLSLPGFSNLV